MLNFTATCTHGIFSVSIWSAVAVICKRDGNDFSFFSEYAIYQPDFTEKNLDWSRPGYLANTWASCPHLEVLGFFFPLGIEKFSSLLKNE